jgi:hypothetical protein
MGIEYYLINKEAKTFYELGKGGWYELTSEMDSLSDVEYMEEFIYDNVFNSYDYPRENDTHWRSYCAEIAKELVQFAKCKNIKNIEMINDCGDETVALRALGYRCTGSRYRKDDDPGYNQECIDFENRHFEPGTAERYQLDKILEEPTISVYILGKGYVKMPTGRPSPFAEIVKRFSTIV